MCVCVFILVPVVHLGGDFLFELRHLILRERAGQDLGAPLDQVIDHVSDRVEHLTLVALLETQSQFKTLQCVLINLSKLIVRCKGTRLLITADKEP